MSEPLTTQSTIAAALWPETATSRWLRAGVLAIAGSLFVALCAQIQVPLMPVPITMQTFAVLAIGAAFGSQLGAATLILYIAEGAAGLPFFAGSSSGPVVLAGPTGGYLLGFVLAAAAVGWLAERGADRTILKMFATMLIGASIVYVPGLPWLASFVGFDRVLQLGLFPFVFGDVLKALLAAVVFRALWQVVKR
jgi:biotin transport system substrate-specific component